MDIVPWLATLTSNIFLFCFILFTSASFLYKAMIYESPSCSQSSAEDQPLVRSESIKDFQLPSSVSNRISDDHCTVSAAKSSKFSSPTSTVHSNSRSLTPELSSSTSTDGSQSSHEAKSSPQIQLGCFTDIKMPASKEKLEVPFLHPLGRAEGTVRKAEFLELKSMSSKVPKSFKENANRKPGPPTSSYAKKRPAFQKFQPGFQGRETKNAGKRPALQNIDWNILGRKASTIPEPKGRTAIRGKHYSDETMDDILVYCSTDDFIPGFISTPPASSQDDQLGASTSSDALLGDVFTEPTAGAGGSFRSKYPKPYAEAKFVFPESLKFSTITGSIGRFSGELATSLAATYQNHIKLEDEDDLNGIAHHERFAWEEEMRALEMQYGVVPAARPL